MKIIDNAKSLVGHIVRLHYYFLLFLAICFLAIGVVAMRNNNLQMITLRNAVYKADEQNNDVEGALRNLRQFVYGHMNTDLGSGGNSIKPPIQLKYTYDRLVASQKGAVAAVNAKITADAQAYCDTPQAIATYPKSRVTCQQTYISNTQSSTENVIPTALYQFDFESPRWSPDLAGYCLLLAASLAVLSVLRFIFEKLVRSYINGRYI